MLLPWASHWALALCLTPAWRVAVPVCCLCAGAPGWQGQAGGWPEACRGWSGLPVGAPGSAVASLVSQREICSENEIKVPVSLMGVSLWPVLLVRDY